MGCAPPLQQLTETCDLSVYATHQATARTSHGTAAAMRAQIAGPSITHSLNKAWRTGGDEFGPAICGEQKMADFAASAGMELFIVGKFGIFGTRTPGFLTGSAPDSGWYK